MQNRWGFGIGALDERQEKQETSSLAKKRNIASRRRYVALGLSDTNRNPK
jgi:hypothetical protein